MRLASTSTKGLPNVAVPPKYTLATLRAFPSLEPLSFVPVPTDILAAPLRRDILWRAVVYENDNKRVGASNPPGRSENGYSRRKLLPQKGSGRARVGDANSPTRHNGGRALARDAPNDYSTELPRKIYTQALNNALSHQYRSGNLFVIGSEEPINPINELDVDILDLIQRNKDVDDRSILFKKFIRENNLVNKKLLFVTSKLREGLLDYTQHYQQKVDIVQQESLEVNDLLKAQKIFVELDVLKYLNKLHLDVLGSQV